MAEIKPVGGWRYAECHVEQSWGYGPSAAPDGAMEGKRTETDNTDDRPAGALRQSRITISREAALPPKLPLAYWATAQRQAPLPNRRQAEPTNYLTPVGRQPNDRRKRQRARGVIAPLFASFASEKRGEWTCVLDPSGERCKARESKRERPVFIYSAANKSNIDLSPATEY